jgi:hypothetical protein
MAAGLHRRHGFARLSRGRQDAEQYLPAARLTFCREHRGIRVVIALTNGDAMPTPIEPPEIPPPTPGTPTEPPREQPPGNPQPEMPPPIREPGEPPTPDELPGKMPDEVPARGPNAPSTPNPATDRAVATRIAI